MSQHNISVGDIIGYKTVFSAPSIIYARVGTLMEVKDSIYTDTKAGEIILELEPVDPMEKMKIKPEVVRLKSIEIVTLYKEHTLCSSKNKESENKQEYTGYKVVTKDEFLIERMQRVNNKEMALECWGNISNGHSFVLSKGEDNYYSVEYIDNYLG